MIIPQNSTHNDVSYNLYYYFQAMIDNSIEERPENKKCPIWGIFCSRVKRKS